MGANSANYTIIIEAIVFKDTRVYDASVAALDQRLAKLPTLSD